MALPETRSDAFKASMEAGDVVIEFGRISGPAAEPGSTAVAVSDRIVLPLETARRLHLSLGEALKPHDAALRAAEAQTLAPEDAAEAMRCSSCGSSPSWACRSSTSAPSGWWTRRSSPTASC